jgi:hypothetical protein
MTSYTKYLNDVVTQKTVFQLRVRTVNVAGIPSAWHYGDIEFDGHQDEPFDLEFLNVTVTGTTANLEWSAITDSSVTLELRHSKDLVDATWSSGTKIKTLVYSAISTTVPQQVGTFMMKTVRSGLESNNHVAAITTVQTTQKNKLVELVEHANFPGIHSQTEVDDSALQLAATPVLIEIMDGNTLATSSGDDILFGNNYIMPEVGTYQFASMLELPEINTVSFTSVVTGASVSLENKFDLRMLKIDEWTDFDDFGGDVEKAIQVRSSNQVRVSSGVDGFGEWVPLIDEVEMSARSFEFRLVLTSHSQAANMRVTELSVSANMSDRTEREFSITTDATGIHSVIYAKPFNKTPFVGISAHDLVGSFEVSGNSVNGFTVTFVDVNGAALPTTFNYQSVGF